MNESEAKYAEIGQKKNSKIKFFTESRPGLGPTQPMPNRYRGRSVRQYEGQRVKLTIPLPVVPRMRAHGALVSLPPTGTPSWRKKRQFCLYFSLCNVPSSGSKKKPPS